MQQFIKIFTFCLLCFSFANNAQAQKKSKDPKRGLSIEQVANICEGIPFEDRITLSVARFSVSTPNAQRKFGGELATMLSSALQEVGCFRVLESIDNLDDLTREIDLGNNGYTSGFSSPQDGQMLGAQLVVTGEVTEYNAGTSGASIAGFGFKTNKANVGFILKVINPQTREILFSKSIDMDSKGPGFSGATAFGLKIAGSSAKNKAIADACEFAIIKAVEILATEKDNIPLPDVDSSLSTSEISITNAEFSTVSAINQLLKSDTQVKDINKSFRDGTAAFRISHKGSIDEILEHLLERASVQFKVTGWEEHRITLAMH